MAAGAGDCDQINPNMGPGPMWDGQRHKLAYREVTGHL